MVRNVSASKNSKIRENAPTRARTLRRNNGPLSIVVGRGNRIRATKLQPPQLLKVLPPASHRRSRGACPSYGVSGRTVGASSNSSAIVSAAGLRSFRYNARCRRAINSAVCSAWIAACPPGHTRRPTQGRGRAPRADRPTSRGSNGSHSSPAPVRLINWETCRAAAEPAARRWPSLPAPRFLCFRDRPSAHSSCPTIGKSDLAGPIQFADVFEPFGMPGVANRAAICCRYASSALDI